MMGLEQAVGDEYEVLLIDDVCSFLTSRLVRNVREMGRSLGFTTRSTRTTPNVSSRDHDVIEEGAAPDEFLATAGATLLHRGAPSSPVTSQAPFVSCRSPRPDRWGGVHRDSDRDRHESPILVPLADRPGRGCRQ